MKKTLTVYRPHSLRLLVSLLGALLLAGAGACRAQNAFTVSLDTSTLISNANVPFSLDFQFSDGSGTLDGNNTATLSNFQFGSGSAIGVSTPSGGASGSLTSGITLTDNSFSNELFQSFTPGNALTFDVLLTGNADVGLTPDEFSFAVLDSTLTEIPTTGSAKAFLIADITAQGAVLQTFAGAGAYAAIGAPTITPAAPVPELGLRPMFGSLLVAGLLGLCCRKRSTNIPRD